MNDYDRKRFQPPAPVATVTFCTSDGRKRSSEVSMLIDSGADFSLLPESCVAELGLEVNTQSEFELMGFDGTKSKASSVQCVMIFADKVFRGIYFITNDEVGIIGRNILNQFTLVLNGPHLCWQEEFSGAN
jgi:hypothetical protein